MLNWALIEMNDIGAYMKGVGARLLIDKELVYNIGGEIYDRIGKGSKLILIGNGGLAADAQHIAAEFVGRFEKEHRALLALALHTNKSSLTTIANDYIYSNVFERQIRTFTKSVAVVIGISASGNSENAIRTLIKGRELCCKTVAMTGAS